MSPMTASSRRHVPRPTRVLAVAIALVLAASRAPAGTTPPGGPLSVEHAAVNEQLGLGGSELVVLEVAPSPSMPLTIGLTLDGVPYTLDLLPHRVRADGFQVLEQRDDGRLVAIDPGPARTLRGSVRDVPGGIVAGGLADDGLRALIELPHLEGRYWVQPAPLAGPGVHVVYHDLDRLEPAGECGVVDEGGEPGDADPPAGGQGGVAGGDECLWTVELAVDADFAYFQDLGDSLAVIATVESIINAMNVQYERDVAITHAISTLIVRTSAEADPYSGNTNPAGLLNEVRFHWNTQMTDVERDVVQMFTGRNLAGAVIGIAYLGGICNDVGYSVVQNYSGFSCQTDLSSHELGHNWNANHCSCPTNTMNSSLTCSNVFHPASTIPELTFYRNSIAGCLDNSCGLTNDDCATATPVGAGSFPFDTSLAFDGGPSETLCGGGLSQIGKDVWYRFMSSCNGPVTVAVCDADFDTRLAVYDTFCPIVASEAIACDDDGCGPQSSLSFEAEDGHRYLIRIGGRNGASGSGTLVIDADDCLPALVNDQCGNGTTVTPGVVAFTTFGATTDGPEGLDCADQLESDVWFRFLAGCDDVTTVRVCDADFDAAVVVYQGPCPDDPAAAVACATAGCGDGFSVTFATEPGAVYRVRIGSTDGSTGSGSFELACGDPPPPCPGDTDGNGAVDVDDLVGVILDWGTDGATNGTDIDGSGLVDVDDLVAVILAWGPCP